MYFKRCADVVGRVLLCRVVGCHVLLYIVTFGCNVPWFGMCCCSVVCCDVVSCRCCSLLCFVVVCCVVLRGGMLWCECVCVVMVLYVFVVVWCSLM